MVCGAQAGKIVAAGPSPGANLIVAEGDKIAFPGNSITLGTGFSDPWYTPLAASWGAHVGTITNLGHSGFRVDQLNPADVVATGAQVCILEAGINDLDQNTPVNTFGTNLDTYFAAVKAGLPGVKLAALSLFSYGEHYPSPFDSKMKSYNAQLLGACARNGVTYIDVYTPAQAYEAVNNIPAPGADTGVLCGDAVFGVHPNNARGIPLICATAASRITTGW